MTDLQTRVLRFVELVGDLTFANIQSHVGLETAALREPVRELVEAGYLRMKDDDQEHDWTYRLTRAGRDALAAGYRSLTCPT